MYIPFRSVETPVEYSPLEATAKEPPRSTEYNDAYQHALRKYRTTRFSATYPLKQLYRHEVCRVCSANIIRERSDVTQTRCKTYGMVLFDLKFESYFSRLGVGELEL